MKFQKFLETIHQPGLPVFTYRGVNWGDAGSVRNHFGNKSGSTKPKPISNIEGFAMSDNGEFYSESELKDLLRKYDIWCKQKGEEPIPLNDLSPVTIKYIQDIIKEE